MRRARSRASSAAARMAHIERERERCERREQHREGISTDLLAVSEDAPVTGKQEGGDDRNVAVRQLGGEHRHGADGCERGQRGRHSQDRPDEPTTLHALSSVECRAAFDSCSYMSRNSEPQGRSTVETEKASSRQRLLRPIVGKRNSAMPAVIGASATHPCRPSWALFSSRLTDCCLRDVVVPGVSGSLEVRVSAPPRSIGTPQGSRARGAMMGTIGQSSRRWTAYAHRDARD